MIKEGTYNMLIAEAILIPQNSVGWYEIGIIITQI